MRDVLIIAKCDKCHSKVEVGEEPLPKWAIDGTTYRPELCNTCVEEVKKQLSWLDTSMTKAKPKSAAPATRASYTRSADRNPRPGPHICDQCNGRAFVSYRSLRIHESKEHNIKSEVHNKHRKPVKKLGGKYADNPTPCPVCDRVFQTPGGLSQHIVQLVKYKNPEHTKYMKEGKSSVTK